MKLRLRALHALRRTSLVLAAALALAPAAQADESFPCKVKDVTVFSGRIHVRCTTMTAAGIYFFALPTSNSVQANRLLTIGSTALVSGRKFVAIYDPGDTSGAAWGCQASDCRALLGFAIE